MSGNWRAGPGGSAVSLSDPGERWRRRIIYPHSYPDFVRSGRSEEELLDILKHVHLAYLPAREGGLDTRKEWKDVLSGGEKQRVGYGNR